MIERRMRRAEARSIWISGKAARLCPFALALFIVVNALSRKPLVRITPSTQMKQSGEV